MAAIDDGAMLIVKLMQSGTGQRWLDLMNEKLNAVHATENRRATAREIVEHLQDNCPFTGPHSVVEKAISFMKTGEYKGPAETEKPLTLAEKMMVGFTPPAAGAPVPESDLANADRVLMEAQKKAEAEKAAAALEAEKKAEAEKAAAALEAEKKAEAEKHGSHKKGGK